MAAKLYTMRTALSRVFAEIFQKKFSSHSTHNPKTRLTFALHRVGQKQGYFKLPLFAFALKMILNLILKLNLKMNSNSKLVLNLILNLILNLKMFHVKHENEFTKSPFMGRKLYYCDSVLSRTFFKKVCVVFASRVPKRKGSPRGA